MHPLWCSIQEGGLLGNPINSESEISFTLLTLQSRVNSQVDAYLISCRVKTFLLTLKGRVICIQSDKGWLPHIEC